MGAGQSIEDEQPISFEAGHHRSLPNAHPSNPQGGIDNNHDPDEVGCFHVLKVEDGSPAAGKLCPYIDFILAINGKRLDHPSHILVHELEMNIDKPVTLQVYRSYIRQTIDVVITPARWGGRGLLGAALRFCTSTMTLDNIWGLAEIEPNSPASEAALVEDVDFIIGVKGVMLGSLRTLEAVLKEHQGRPTILFVFNTKSRSLREVAVIPDINARDCLGCIVERAADRVHVLTTSTHQERNLSVPNESNTTDIQETPNVVPVFSTPPLQRRRTLPAGQEGGIHILQIGDTDSSDSN